MEIRCKSSKRFLLKINIDEFYSIIKKNGYDVTIPLEIEVPCSKCKMIEVFDIYPTHYIHKKSYKHKS